MFKSLLIGFASIPFAIIAFVIGWAVHDWRVGIVAGGAVMGIFMLWGLIFLLTLKTFSWADVILPVPAACIWCILLTPLSLGTEVFTAPACIGSAILLSISFALVKTGEMRTAWAILPAAMFTYEMLPVNIPGPLDDYLAFGGAVGSLILQLAYYNMKRTSDELSARSTSTNSEITSVNMIPEVQQIEDKK